MNEQLRLYREFVDAMVSLRRSVLGLWITKRGWPDLPENEAINGLLARLSTEDKAVLADIVFQARWGGIHDVLAWLNDEANRGGLRLVRKGVELAVEPYGTEMHFDFVARADGEEWPDADLKPEYRSP